MGIKGLNKLIYQYANSSMEDINISDLCGAKIAIDSEILMHKFKSVDSNNSHITGFVNNVFSFLRNGIIPIYIFDGVPNISKQTNAILKRHTHKKHMNEEAEELEKKVLDQIEKLCLDNNSEESIQILGNNINYNIDKLLNIQKKINFMSVSKNYRKECKYLLKVMGIPFITAIEDAEALCVNLCVKKLVDYVMTEDTDAMAYLVAHYSNTEDIDAKILKINKFNQNALTCVNVKSIVKQLKIDPKSFVDMCILSGCDFCPSISKIGSIRAYHFMLEHKSIENLIDSKEFKEHGYTVPCGFNYNDAREIFYKDHYKEYKSLNIEPMLIEDLERYLIDERGLNPKPIIEEYNKMFEIFTGKNDTIKTGQYVSSVQPFTAYVQPVLNNVPQSGHKINVS